MSRLLRLEHCFGAAFLCGMILLCASQLAIAEDERTIYPGEDNTTTPEEITPVEIRFYDGDAEIEAGDGSRPRFGRRMPSTVKGGTCGAANDCSLRSTEDVVLVMDIPTSGYWSFSLCGSSFDTYIFVGYSPCSADIGSNDDFCGTNSLAGCLWVQSGPVYVTIEAGTNTCGKFVFSIQPCVPGRCCYMLADSAACENTTLDECAQIGGFWDADATCEANPCPTGRCCYRNGNISECVENLLQKPCLFNLEGEWTEGGSCDDPCIFEGDSSACGPMDLVLVIDVTGSMNDEIDAVRTEAQEILATAVDVAGQDLRVGLVTFSDRVYVLHPLTDDLAAVDASIAILDADGGYGTPEASDIALREIVTNNGECVQHGDFSQPFRTFASKVVVLITDAPNGGCNDHHESTDETYAHEVALAALDAGIHISAVYVYTYSINPVTEAVMRDYAETTGGLYVTSPNGEGIAGTIGDIIQQCGQVRLSMVADSVPDLQCTDDGITPTTFDITVSVVNQSDEPVGNGGILLTDGSGPGGTGNVLSANPITLGEVQPHDTVVATFTVNVTPSASGGCINFTAYLLNGADSVGTRVVCVEIPTASLAIGRTTVPVLACDGNGVTPTTFDIGVQVYNDSECATAAGGVAMRFGAGPGGFGTVQSANPLGVGMLQPGDSTMLYFNVHITPDIEGGCITFRAYLTLDGDTIGARNICVDIPTFGIVFYHHTVPQVSCVDDEISPTTFDVVMMVRNTSECELTGARIEFAPSGGAGGSGVVVSSSSVPLGPMAPGAEMSVPFTVTIDPNSLGGQIRFTATLMVGEIAMYSRDAVVYVPACGCESSNGISREFNGSYYYECFCVQLCDTIPIPISICRPSGAFSNPPAVWLDGGCNTGCAAGQASLIGSNWERNGECWENVIRMTLPGCVRLCLDYWFPVELSSFEAIAEFERVRVLWSTASESEMDHFEILRDGVLMHVATASNSAGGSSYEWLDTFVETGHLYEYQLVAVDMSGAREVLASASAMPLARPSVIQGFALLPNYPNPFNGFTTIGFELPETADVTLTVYDVRGRQVMELVNGRFETGRHSVNFGGDELASGLYFCHMQAGSFSTRQKMLLLK